MAIIKYKNAGITAISACVPKNVSSNRELRSMMSEEEVEKVINSVGIKEKRIADKDICASDLCFKAAEKLLEENRIDRESVDVLLFLSQLPDYKIPATAPVLQDRLHLPKTTAALDLSLGCSGYVYGLATAMSFASQEGVNRVLLLVGETFSKIVNRQDKVNAPLYGDAGTATLIEKRSDNEAIFSLYSDGAGKNAVIIKSGEARFPDTVESFVPREREEGNIRADSELFMDGMDVFNFALSVVPKNIKEICAIANTDITNVEHIVLHQANKFMTDFIVKRLKYPVEKVPYCLDRYGNTSSASIPLTISSEFAGKNIGNIVMCGFGAGLSWGSAYLSLDQCNISKVIDY
jgi:3-oxoacyl-[acyl-carrier-protein] synthase-3